ncbi:MAG TPA: biotin synthase BioB [Sulfurimonas sp.]|nr:biotin synthase BioB [Sulfurimonas sp.]
MYTAFAQKALSGESLSISDMHAVLQAPNDEILPLLHAAFQVRRHYFGNKVQIHVLMNAKSGLCPEDCGYCSQSSISKAPIDKYPLRPTEEIVDAARKASESGAYRYCIVASGRAPTDNEIDAVAHVVREIKQAVDIDICCCLGLLTEDKARRLKEAGVDRVNHNLNTSRQHTPNIVSTHTYDDRLKTLHNIQKVGLDTCCGGIIGMGETHDDIIDMAVSLKELCVDSIPVNFLHPIGGTPLANRDALTPHDCLKALCLFRFVNPTTEIRVAGGREKNLRTLQPLALYPANSLFMEGYLTTGGLGVEETHQMIADLGFEIETIKPGQKSKVKSQKPNQECTPAITQ